MPPIHGDSFLVLLRYWRDGKTIQKQRLSKCEKEAYQLARNASEFCVKDGLDYFVEVLPKFGKTVAQGSKLGLLRRKELF